MKSCLAENCNDEELGESFLQDEDLGITLREGLTEFQHVLSHHLPQEHDGLSYYPGQNWALYSKDDINDTFLQDEELGDIFLKDEELRDTFIQDEEPGNTFLEGWTEFQQVLSHQLPGEHSGLSYDPAQNWAPKSNACSPLSSDWQHLENQLDLSWPTEAEDNGDLLSQVCASWLDTSSISRVGLEHQQVTDSDEVYGMSKIPEKYKEPQKKYFKNTKKGSKEPKISLSLSEKSKRNIARCKARRENMKASKLSLETELVNLSRRNVELLAEVDLMARNKETLMNLARSLLPPPVVITLKSGYKDRKSVV